MVVETRRQVPAAVARRRQAAVARRRRVAVAKRQQVAVAKRQQVAVAMKQPKLMLEATAEQEPGWHRQGAAGEEGARMPVG